MSLVVAEDMTSPPAEDGVSQKDRLVSLDPCGFAALSGRKPTYSEPKAQADASVVLNVQLLCLHEICH